jgi:hypothetical protein
MQALQFGHWLSSHKVDICGDDIESIPGKGIVCVEHGTQV